MTMAREITDQEAVALILNRVPPHIAGRAALADAYAKIEAAGRLAQIDAIKARARAYTVSPYKLNAMFYGLADASPDDGLAIVEGLIRDEIGGGPRFPINVPLMNLLGARLYFRWERRAGELWSAPVQIAAE
jgi:hypothetical protein